MAAGVEREVKLRFADAGAARSAVTAAGGVLKRARRLQHDAVLDTARGTLRDAQSVLRVRLEDHQGLLTFKGPPQPSTMKTREEIETGVADTAAAFTLLDRLGFNVIFRYEKFREEFLLGGCTVAVDETPVGTFVEVEGDEHAVRDVTVRLGRTADDFIVESYRALYLQRCQEEGVPGGDMLFGSAERA